MRSRRLATAALSAWLALAAAARASAAIGSLELDTTAGGPTAPQQPAGPQQPTAPSNDGTAGRHLTQPSPIAPATGVMVSDPLLLREKYPGLYDGSTAPQSGPGPSSAHARAPGAPPERAGQDGGLLSPPEAAHAVARDALRPSADAPIGEIGRPSAAAASVAAAVTAGAPNAAAVGPAAQPASRLNQIVLQAAEPLGGPAAQTALRVAALRADARRLLQLGDADAAMKALTEAVRLDPTAAGTWADMAGALNKIGRAQDALRDAETAVRLDAKERAAWEALAWARLSAGDYRGAVEAATQALLLDPNDALALAVRARARWALGDRQGALADAEAAARLDRRFEALSDAMRSGRFDAGQPFWADDAARAAPSPAGRSAPGWPLAAALLVLSAAAAAAFVKARSRAARVRTFSSLARRDAGLVGGKYELRRLIGRGGMGEVHEAYDRTLKRLVAVKTVSPDSGEDPERLRRLIASEATTVAALHHPNIVDIYEIVDSGGRLHLVFELVSGKTLAQIIAAEGGGLPLDAALAVFDPICRALQFAHDRQLVHRDLKPANVMVSSDGFVKLMDFGIARGVGTTSGANTRTVMGSPAYMPPEAESGEVSKAGDIYALGVALYETLVGRPPFQTTAQKVLLEFALPSAFKAELPAELDALIASALDPDPGKRPGSANEFLSALLAAANKDRTPPSRVAA